MHSSQHVQEQELPLRYLKLVRSSSRHQMQIGAVTIKLPGTLTNLLRGAMIPIVALARPDDDGIKK